MKSMKAYVMGMAVSILTASAGVAQQAPDFTVTDLSGTEHQLYHDYLDDGQVVVMGFFYVGAPLATEIFSSLQDLANFELAEEAPVQFLLMSNLDTESDLVQFADQASIDIPLVGYEGGADDAMTPYMTGEFGIFYGYPMFVLVGPDGTVIYDPWGDNVEDTIAQISNAIDLLLGEGTNSIDEAAVATPTVLVTPEGLDITVPTQQNNSLLNLYHSDGRLYFEGFLNEGRNAIPVQEKGISLYSIQSRNGRRITGKFSK